MVWQIISKKRRLLMVSTSSDRLCVSDEISEQKDDMLQAEEGFRGTLLTSTVSAQLCQDIAFSE
jgi:hypothetical protein